VEFGSHQVPPRAVAHGGQIGLKVLVKNLSCKGVDPQNAMGTISVSLSFPPFFFLSSAKARNARNHCVCIQRENKSFIRCANRSTRTSDTQQNIHTCSTDWLERGRYVRHHDRTHRNYKTTYHNIETMNYTLWPDLYIRLFPQHLSTVCLSIAIIIRCMAWHLWGNLIRHSGSQTSLQNAPVSLYCIYAWCFLF